MRLRTMIPGLRLLTAGMWLASMLGAQNPPQNPGAALPQQPAGISPATAATPTGLPNQVERLRPNYVLQIGDQIMIRARDIEELADRPFRIETDGTVNLPLVGRIRAAELTVEGLESALTTALRQFVVNPQISITVTQFKSDPVFVVGAFRSPGIYPLQGRRTLVELLTSVGGLAPNAGRKLRLTRRVEAGKIPLPNAVLSPDGRYSSVDINIISLQTTVNSLEDITLEAYDIISAERAEMIFMVGAISRVGGIEIGERESLSMLQALSLSGGLTLNASAGKAYILRPVMNTARRAEIPIDIKRLLRGEGNDFPLLPNDILFVPTSYQRIIIDRAVTLATGIASAIIFTQFQQR